MLFIIPLAVACTKDKGSYNYTELNELTISNMEDSYRIEQFTSLKISPVITGNMGFNPEDYDYLWFTYQYNTNRDISDTLSREKELNTDIAIATGVYQLVFRATEKATGILYTQECSITVVNSFTGGLLALSNVNGDANVTFINTAYTVIEDAFQRVNGRVAGKNPRRIQFPNSMLQSYLPVYIFNDDEVGGVIVNRLDYSYQRDFREAFHFPPEVIKPQNIGHGAYGNNDYICNDGDIHVRDLQVNPMPRFGIRVEGDYKVAPFTFMNTIGTSFCFFYDMKNQRFIYMNFPLDLSNTKTTFQLESDYSAYEFDPKNVGMDMLWGDALGAGVTTISQGRAVMQNAAGERYMFSFDLNNRTLTPDKKWKIEHPGIAQARSFTSVHPGNFLYYAYENKIVCISFSTNNLLAVYEFPAGTQIDHIEGGDFARRTQMWVATSNGSKAKNSGSIHYMTPSTDGSLTLDRSFPNVCGQVVDFEYKP